MVDKKTYISYIEKLNMVCSKYELKTLIEDNNKLMAEIEDFMVHILLMGGFSAGKSALLNALTNREVLPENQGEETAIATELIYDEKEYIEAVSKDGIDTYELDEIKEIPSEKYEHLRVHMDSAFLGKIPGIRLVDMPGLDSKVEHHNKAIMQFIGNGNAYLLCVDCQDGVLKSSRADFIKEVKQYRNSLALVITKCDKKPTSQLESIAANIQKSAEAAFQEELKTFKVSAFDEDIEKKALEMIESFDTQSLFEQAFIKRLEDNLSLCMKSLVNIRNSSDFSEKEINAEIEKIQISLTELDKKLKKEEKKLNELIVNEVKPKILGDVETQLRNSIPGLASAAMTSSEAFSRVINNIVRPVLLSSTERYVEESFDEFIDEIGIIKEFDDSFAYEIADQYDDISRRWNAALERNKKADGTYKAIFGTLAVLTDVVAPWVELIIIFLPQILQLFGSILQKSQEDSVRNKIEFEIIPQIIEKIGMELEPTLMEMKDVMLEDLREKHQIACQSKLEAIQKLQFEKDEKKSEYEVFLGEIDEDMAAVTELMNTLI